MMQPWTYAVLKAVGAAVITWGTSVMTVLQADTAPSKNQWLMAGIGALVSFARDLQAQLGPSPQDKVG